MRGTPGKRLAAQVLLETGARGLRFSQIPRNLEKPERPQGKRNLVTKPAPFTFVPTRLQLAFCQINRQHVHRIWFRCVYNLSKHSLKVGSKACAQSLLSMGVLACVREWMSEWLGGWVSEWAGECVGVSVWACECASVWVSVCGGVSWMIGWVSGCVSGWINEIRRERRCFRKL